MKWEFLQYWISFDIQYIWICIFPSKIWKIYLYTVRWIWFKTNKWYICIIFKQILADFFTFIIESLRDPLYDYPSLPSHYFLADCEASEKATLKTEKVEYCLWKYLWAKNDIVFILYTAGIGKIMLLFSPHWHIWNTFLFWFSNWKVFLLIKKRKEALKGAPYAYCSFHPFPVVISSWKLEQVFTLAGPFRWKVTMCHFM